jgi:N-acetylglutamate synthase-like GNAT family acetyltransferase
MRLLNKKIDQIPYDLLLLADETKEAISKYIFDSEIYVHEEKEKIIGLYVLYKVSAEIIEIKNIAVATSHQGMGIGKQMLKDACVRAKKNGFTEIIIGTGDVLSMQLQLYKSDGFEEYDKKRNFFIENYPEPIFENGQQLRDMVMLRKKIV